MPYQLKHLYSTQWHTKDMLSNLCWMAELSRLQDQDLDCQTGSAVTFVGLVVPFSAF